MVRATFYTLGGLPLIMLSAMENFACFLCREIFASLVSPRLLAFLRVFPLLFIVMESGVATTKTTSAKRW